VHCRAGREHSYRGGFLDSSVGAKGIGAQLLVPTVPAIRNAIRPATGARIRRRPATPDRLRAAMPALQDENKNGRR